MAMFAVVFHGKCSTQTALHRLKLGRSDAFRDKWWSMPTEVEGLLASREEDLTVGKLSHSCRKDCGSEAITGGPENELWWLWSVEFQQGILGQTL